MSEDEEEMRLRSVALQNAHSILAARQRAEQALVRAKEELEQRTNELARSLAMMRATLEATSDGILVTDGDRRITGHNQRYAQMWRVPDGLLDQGEHGRVLELLSREFADPGRFLRRVHEIYQSSPAESFDLLELGDGRVFERSSRIQFLEGRNVGRVWSFHDVTERKRAEARQQFLVKLDDTVRPLTDPGEITASSARLLGEHLGVDRCAYAEVEADEDTFNLTGDYTRGVPSIVGRYRLADFGSEVLRLHRRNKPYVAADVEADPALAPGDLAAFRQTQIRAVIAIPLHKGGKFVAGMAVHQKAPREWTAGDVELLGAVANRCWESIERARVVRSLKESEEKFRAVVETTPECVKIVSPDGSLLYMNRAGLSMIGADSGPAVHGARVCDLIAPEHRTTWQENHERVCRGERLSWEFEIVGLRGARRWAETHAVPLPMPDGRLAHLAVTRDVTQRKHAEAERERLLEAEKAARSEAERVSRLKDEFLATLSHELRTPLNAILGWSQLLRARERDDEELREGLDVVERNARVQTQLIEDLLDMSRIISGKVRLDVQRVDLQDVVKAAVASVRHSAEAKAIRLQVVLDPMTGPVRGDPNRLQQCFWNLLSNAIKFTPKGGKVQVGLERVNSHLEVCVADNGQGIRPEFLPHVFERFRQADGSTTRAHGGLGLGLSIVKHLVELHGGSVRAKSAGEGRGATFCIELPLMVVHGPEPEMAREHPRGAAGTVEALDHPSLAGVIVLVVDDEPDARYLLKRVLEQCGAKVLLAASAQEGFERLRRERPDMLVSDIGMPGEDGYDFIRRVRKLPADEGGRTPAAALTAFARAEDRTRALRAGYQTHVAKPVEPTELSAVVASLASRH